MLTGGPPQRACWRRVTSPRTSHTVIRQAPSVRAAVASCSYASACLPAHRPACSSHKAWWQQRVCACRTLFDQLDTDGSGGIDGDELAAGLAAQGYQVLPRAPAAAAWAANPASPSAAACVCTPVAPAPGWCRACVGGSSGAAEQAAHSFAARSGAGCRRQRLPAMAPCAAPWLRAASQHVRPTARRADVGACAKRQVSRGEVDKLLDRVDVNSDGHVEFGELASALVDWRQARGPCARPARAGAALCVRRAMCVAVPAGALARGAHPACAAEPRTPRPLPSSEGALLLAAAAA